MTPEDDLLTPAEVARKFRVDPKTVTRWAAAGRLPSIKTLGGHRRYREWHINLLLQGLPIPEEPPPPKPEPAVLDVPGDVQGFGIGAVSA